MKKVLYNDNLYNSIKDAMAATGRGYRHITRNCQFVEDVNPEIKYYNDHVTLELKPNGMPKAGTMINTNGTPYYTLHNTLANYCAGSASRKQRHSAYAGSNISKSINEPKSHHRKCWMPGHDHMYEADNTDLLLNEKCFHNDMADNTIADLEDYETLFYETLDNYSDEDFDFIDENIDI